jgi:hypothetical protein
MNQELASKVAFGVGGTLLAIPILSKMDAPPFFFGILN